MLDRESERKRKQKGERNKKKVAGCVSFRRAKSYKKNVLSSQNLWG